ncbi:MAG: hypothetical protein M3Q97_05070, partial [Bacteroidota bacterium]|nr:hypothetical protein [Bacteroidota bacterium]
MIKIATLVFLAGILTCFFTPSLLRATNNPCDATGCTPWQYSVDVKFKKQLSNQCWYDFIYRYKFRTCNGVPEFAIEDVVVSYRVNDTLNNGLNCTLNLIQCDEIMKAVEKHHVMVEINLQPGQSVISRKPSSCYYKLKVNLPQALLDCWGFSGYDPSQSEYYVIKPCDAQGCCLVELTVNANGTVTRSVLASLPCNGPAPVILDDTLRMGCDLVGGGVQYYTVTVVPGQSPTCDPVCSPGMFITGEATDIERSEPDVKGYTVYPNP